jgi:hypothetical protein
MKQIKTILLIFFLIIWSVIFTFSVLWLYEGKYLIVSYSIIAFSLVLGFILWAGSIKKEFN